MRKNLGDLTDREFDLVVIGGGIFGACAAWDATQRGLSVALVERSDFGGATSANSYKMIHGGIRYIQHGDIPRLRASSNERRAFLRIAPHLVRPLPIAIPTFGWGMRGKFALAVGTTLYDWLTLDRNRGLPDTERRIPACRIASRAEILEVFPGLERQEPTGAVIMCDGQMYNPPRLVLGFVRSAAESGAIVANYVEACELLRDGDRVCGVRVRCHLAGEEFSVRGKVILNAAGPYASLLAAETPRSGIRTPLSRDACFVVKRRLTPPALGLAVQGATKDPEAVLSRGERHLFVVPWRDYSLIGVWHKVYTDHPDRLSVSSEELNGFVDEINGAAPWLEIDRSEVATVNTGLVPFGENRPNATNLKYGHRSVLVDHARTERLEGLITLVGVRFTTGRLEARRAVDLVFKKLGHRPQPSRTDETPIWGGQIESLEGAIRDAARRHPELDPEITRALVHNYGSEAREVEACFAGEPEAAGTIGETTTLRAEVLHAVRTEMAEKLTDIVYRRTDLGTAGVPETGEIEEVACLMAAEKGWTGSRRSDEILDVMEFSLLDQRLGAQC